jgi:pilus assembly protein CpaB
MKGSARRTIFLAAICAGLLAVLLVYLFLDTQKTRAAHMVRLSREPVGVLPPNCTASVEEVKEKVAIAAIGAGQPIQRQDIAVRNASLGLAYLVKPDMRAVTVALDPIIGVAGFLRAGDHVDVLATFKIDDLSVTKTVLQDVELLALGGEAQATEVANKSGAPARAQQQPTATLSVTPEQAEKMILAESRGKLRLTLRSVGDSTTVALRGIDSVKLTGYGVNAGSVQAKRVETPRPPVTSVGYNYASPAFAPGPFFDRPRIEAFGAGGQGAVSQGNTVEVIRGTEKTVVQVSAE